MSLTDGTGLSATDILVPIVCGCCQSVTITNTSTIPINMQNASVKI